MKNTLEKIDRVVKKINEVILIFVFIVMFIMVFSTVIGRYFFNLTYYWVDEIARFLMISIAFFGFGLAMRYGNHASFSVVQDVLPDKARKVLRFIVLLIILGFMAFFCYLGWRYAMMNWENRTEALRWRNGLWYLMIPIGSFLFIWHTLIISGEFINQSRSADIEREIAAGAELIGSSEFLKEIDTNEKTDGE